MKRMNVADIEECIRVHVRAKVNATAVDEYADAYKCGQILPPIVVFQEDGCERFIVADGRHRLAAAKKAGLKTVEVDLHSGDETDALKFALQCNAEHGLRRSKDDLICAVGQLMSNGKLEDQYRTHRERSELLRISEPYFQSLLAMWRKRKPGSKREAAAQKKAEESAKKHNGKKAPTSASSRKKPARARPAEPEPIRVEVPKSAAKPAAKTNGQSALPTAEVHDVTRGIALLASCKLDPEKLAASGKLNWSQVEKAADVLWKLMEQR